MSNIIVAIIVLLILSKVLSKPRGRTIYNNRTQQRKVISNAPRDDHNHIDRTSVKKVNSKQGRNVTTMPNISQELKGFDPNDHYHRQYKDLYDAGIMTKDELRDRITTNSK